MQFFGRAVFLLIAALFTASCGIQSAATELDAPSKYQKSENWVFRESEALYPADVFFVAPTVYTGDEKQPNMPLYDPELREAFAGVVKMEKGIYDQQCNFFAPYYGQVGLPVYMLSDEVAKPYFDRAYADVKEAFLYYLNYENQGRPFILAGFSQGSQMLVRLLKDCSDPRLQDRLIAVYAIGWRITQEDLKRMPGVRMAQGAADTGVIVSFNTEAPDVGGSFLIPEGEKALAINPLNWSATSGLAGRQLHRGAVFVDKSGEIKQEIPEFTGAYLDAERGALKVTDVDSEAYPPVLSIVRDGVYHIYDYMFFYRNLQENVKQRVDSFFRKYSPMEKAA